MDDKQWIWQSLRNKETRLEIQLHFFYSVCVEADNALIDNATYYTATYKKYAGSVRSYANKRKQIQVTVVCLQNCRLDARKLARPLAPHHQDPVAKFIQITACILPNQAWVSSNEISACGWALLRIQRTRRWWEIKLTEKLPTRFVTHSNWRTVSARMHLI